MGDGRLGAPMRPLHDPALVFTQDHVAVSLDRASSLLTLSPSFVIPYSTILSASVSAPPIPGIAEGILTGLYLPSRLAKGRFRGWHGRRAFLWLDGSHTRALVLSLAGHPQFDEVAIASEHADAWLARLDHARKGARA